MIRPGIIASAAVVLIALAGLVPACAADIPPMPPLKTFHTEVPVAHDGGAVCVIAVPPGDEYRQLGEKLAVVQQFDARLTELGIPHRFTVVAGVGHKPGAFLRIQADNEEYWDFYRDAFGG